MLAKSGRFRLRIALLLSVLSALIVTGLAPANAVDLSDASISGKVTAPAGVDLASTQVYAHTASGYSYTGYSQVNEDGTYAINGLPAGTYKIQFSGSNYSGALEQWHAGASSFETATTVTLAAGQTLTGINASLVKGATISGRITGPSGVDIGSVGVSVQSTGDDWFSAYGSVNQDGSYSVRGLPAGSYKIQFAGGNSGAVTQWHAAATSFDTATPVTLTAGQDLTGINAALVRGASISGTVTVPAGADASQVHVEARDINGNTAGYSSISSEGTYSLRGLRAGSYKVLFSSYGTGLLQQWYPGASSFDTATAVTVAAGQDKTGIGASLVTGGSVSGKVTAPAGIDLSLVHATVYEAAGPNPNYVGSSSVNADGTYKVDGLNTGNYKVQFLGTNSGLLEHWYNGAASFGTATAVAVTAGQNHAGVDAALVKGASITGKVSSAPGVNLSGVWIYLYDSETMSWAGGMQPSPDGSYQFAGLAAGSYKIQFSTGSSGALGQWYGGAVAASAATPVAVSSSQDLTLPDTVLIKGATISGKVTAPAGVDLSAVSVYAYNSKGSLSYPGYTNVQPDGSYKLAGLPQGDYAISFSGYNSGALDQWHANATSRESATVLPVASGQDVTGINATLVKGASISGKVTVPVGVTLSGVSVSASGEGSPYGTYASVNADGTYKVKGLPAGSYKVKFSNYNSGALDEWYNNVQTEAAATPVVLACCQDKTAVDATLAKGATIGGKVTLPAGVNAFAVSVGLFKAADGESVSSVQLNSDGTYALRGVPAGSYKLRFAGYSNAGVLARWYTNATSLATATPVTVTDGQTLTAINAALVKGGAISGQITAPAGTRLTASEIVATKTGTIDDSSVHGWVNTDGTYSIVGLETGTYKLRFLGGQSGAEDLWYGGTTAATANSVAVTAGQTVAGANMTVVKGATISGNVSGASGQPGYLLSVLDSAGKLVKNSYSDEAGNYSVVGLAAGSYRVAFNRSSGFTQDEAQYYQNQPESAGAGQAQSIPVTSGQTVPNINASLTAGGSVTGTVLDKAGKPVANAQIQAYTPDGSLVTRSAGTSATGKYTLNGLTSGSYIIKVHGALSGRGDLYSGNKTAEATATKVSVVRGSATTHDLSYAAVVETLTAPTPTVKGTAKVGYTLTGAPGTWGPAGVTLKYQWKANGVDITGATATAFKLTAAQVGKTLTFSVTGTKAGYTTATKTSAATGTVMALNPVLTAPTPKITGTAKVGYALTAVPGAWGPAPITLKYQWKANGIVIAGATASTYKPSAAVVGKTISVTVTGSKAGYNTAAKTSTLTARVAVGTLAAPVPKVTGTAKVGYTLTAVPGAWGPAPVTLKYQWKANGVAVTGATASTYKPAAAVIGKTISVTVTGSKAGFTTAARTSALTARVAVGTLTAPVPVISGAVRVGAALTAAGAWGPAPVTLKYHWKANGLAITGATAATYTPTTAVLGKTLTVTVTGSKAGFTTVTKTSAVSVKVAVGVLTAPVPTISGSPTAGSVLTVVPGAWGPAPVTLKYQWYLNGMPLSGATGTTYTPMLPGDAISVRVTGSKPGFTTAEKPSAPTPTITVREPAPVG